MVHVCAPGTRPVLPAPNTHVDALARSSRIPLPPFRASPWPALRALRWQLSPCSLRLCVFLLSGTLTPPGSFLRMHLPPRSYCAPDVPSQAGPPPAAGFWALVSLNWKLSEARGL